MRFTDYNAKYAELMAAVRAAEDEHQGSPIYPRPKPLLEWGTHPTHQAFEAFRRPMDRRYWISERAYVEISPQGSADFPYCATVAVRWERDGDSGMNTNPMPHQLTPDEHRGVANVIEMVNSWVSGARSTLPPSGRWSRPQQISRHQLRLLELIETRPRDGRFVELRENRGGWHFAGLSGTCECVSDDGSELVMIVADDPNGYWQAGTRILVGLDRETTAFFHVVK